MTDAGSRAGRIVRYTFQERAVHAAAAMTYVYLLLTGLAFWTPAFFWIAVMLGGGFVTRAVHPWVGVVFALVVLRMLQQFRHDMATTAVDREWRRAIVHYARNEDDRVPGAGRFNYGQKSLFWVMVWSTLTLLASGVVLWFPDAVPPGGRWLREAAVLVHAIAALVTIGGFIVHIYMGLLVVPGGWRAIVHGWVSPEWARLHHPRWLDK
jgi:formate dehydrogenase subunit gamma